METLPPNAGWQWIKEGFALFRKQPAELSTLFLSYMFVMLIAGIIPVAGQLLPLLLAPMFSIAFMQACLNIERGKRAYPNLLLTGFRSPAMRTLLKLGVCYIAVTLIVIGASSLVDGGVFWKVMSGSSTLDEKMLRDSNMTLAMVFAALLYIPAAMGFWYAAPLIAWQNMSLGKALFYSFFAVCRALKAFLVYGLAWVTIGMVLPILFSLLVAAIVGKAGIAMAILLPLSIVLTIIMYCSFYPSYTYVFGKPGAINQG